MKAADREIRAAFVFYPKLTGIVNGTKEKTSKTLEL